MILECRGNYDLVLRALVLRLVLRVSACMADIRVNRVN
jgi:hypothetical protein